jgi:hypothetical protein
MKRSAVLFAASLAANAAFFVAFSFRPALAPPAVRDFIAHRSVHPTASSSSVPSPASRLPSPASPSPSLWSQFDSADLPTLIARLRAAGFSPVTIKAIVSARIEARHAERMNQLLATAAAAPYWKPDHTSSINNPGFFETYGQINRERTSLLRELLADDFFAEAGRDPTAEQRRQFGDLPKAKIDLLQRIVDDYAEMTAQVRTATQGIPLPEDREKFALLERELRADLARVLTPAELEEYDVRTSPTAHQLRQTLMFMDASEAEFRAIYRIHSSQVNGLHNIDEQLRSTLGEQRYADYALANSEEFQKIGRLAYAQGISLDAVRRTFDLLTPTAKESERIFQDNALTPEQKRAALQALGQNAHAQLIATLGPNAGGAYAQTSDWLRIIEAGGAASLGPDGRVSKFSILPPSSRPPPRSPPTN